MLKGKTKIGTNCIIEMNSSIENSTIGNNTEVKNSTIIDSIIGENTTVGPYAYLRPKSNIGNNVKIGDFVEVKNATIGDNSKASHLSYIGDAEVGKNVNIGCGVVFVNYDGKNKFKSIVKYTAYIAGVRSIEGRKKLVVFLLRTIFENIWPIYYNRRRPRKSTSYRKRKTSQ